MTTALWGFRSLLKQQHQRPWLWPSNTHDTAVRQSQGWTNLIQHNYRTEVSKRVKNGASIKYTGICWKYNSTNLNEPYREREAWVVTTIVLWCSGNADAGGILLRRDTSKQSNGAEEAESRWCGDPEAGGRHCSVRHRRNKCQYKAWQEAQH